MVLRLTKYMYLIICLSVIQCMLKLMSSQCRSTSAIASIWRLSKRYSTHLHPIETIAKDTISQFSTRYICASALKLVETPSLFETAALWTTPT